MEFIDKLKSRLDSTNSHVCIGLDSRYDRIPVFIKRNRTISNAILEFNKNIIHETSNIAIAYKINIAFYEGFGIEGIKGLKLTTKYLKKRFPEIVLLADCKRSEIGDAALMLRKQIFDWLGFDCIMLTPWFGSDSIEEFIKDKKHGVLIYVHDSNSSAEEVQDLKLVDNKSLYEFIAYRLTNVWNKYGNIIVESGATYPKQLKKIRKIVGDDMPILTAGIGAQGASVMNLKGLFGKNNRRLIVNSSRAIIFAGGNKDDYFLNVRKAAIDLQKKILEISSLN